MKYRLLKVHYEKLKSQGWKRMGVILPPEVFNKVREYKNLLMKEYLNERKKDNKPSSATR